MALDFLRVPSCPLWFKILDFIPGLTAGKAAQTPQKSSAGSAPHPRRRSSDDRKKATAAESAAARICR